MFSYNASFLTSKAAFYKNSRKLKIYLNISGTLLGYGYDQSAW